MFTLTNLINDAVVILGAGGFVKWLLRNGPAIEKVAKEVIKDAALIPAVKVKEEELKRQTEDTLAKFHESELGKLAAAGLNAFDAELNGLSEDQKRALLFHIATLIPQDWNVSRDDIEKALVEAQKISDSISGNSLIVSANKFTEELNLAQIQAKSDPQPAASAEQTQTPA